MMGAPREAGPAGGNALAESRPARRGPRILRCLFGGAASPLPASEFACPPRLRRIVRNAMLDTAKSASSPAFSVPSLDAIGNDLGCRQLAEALPAAMERADRGLCAGLPAAELRGEIKNLIMDDVMGVVAGLAVRDAGSDLSSGGRHEREIFFGTIGALVAEHLAAGLVGGSAPAPGAGNASPPPPAGRKAAGLIRAALLSAERAAPMAAKVARGIHDATADCVRAQGAAEGNDPTITITSAVAGAVAEVGAPTVPHGQQYPRDSGRRGRGDGRATDSICRGIVRRLASPPTKIDRRGKEGA